MKRKIVMAALKQGATLLSIALASQLAAVLGGLDPDAPIYQVAPVFGLSLGILLTGGYQYLGAILVGALVPAIFAGGALTTILSVPLGVACASVVGVFCLRELRVDTRLERIRDTLLTFIFGGVLGGFVGSLVVSILLFADAASFTWDAFTALLLAEWLSITIGTVILTPFVLAWADPTGLRLGPRRILEVGIWFLTLLAFGFVTFRNWAPTDTLLYPMELAIFPIMAWASIRFGLRGATGGVLALALLAALELILILVGSSPEMTQSPANIWAFVGIVSVTSVSLASVMTEWREREAQIAENESRLRAFTEALPDVAFVLTEGGVIQDVFAANPMIEANHRIFDASRIRGKPIGEIFEPTVSKKIVETVRAALDFRMVKTFDYSLVSVDVGRHWFEARISPMSEALEDGTRRVVWVAYDITTRRRSEAAIRCRDVILRATAEANRQLLTTRGLREAVVGAMGELATALQVDRACIVEISGADEDGFHSFETRFAWQRPGVRSISTVSALGKRGPLEEFFPGWRERLSSETCIRLQGAPTETARDAEVLETLKCASLLAVPLWLGTELYGFLWVEFCEEQHAWMESETSAMEVLAASISGFLMIWHNATMLQAARDEARAASAAKGAFLARMSHEIRSPMNAVIGYTDLLLQTELSHEQKENASIIRRSGHALLELINNILDFSKIESKSLELETLEFSPEQIVCEAIETVAPSAREKGLKVDYSIAEDVGDVYQGDPQRLRQILVNLVSNAVKFTREGSVFVSLSLRKKSGTNAVAPLYFQVVDTGIGIPEDRFERLFQVFSQADASVTREYGGSGLGLAIAKQLVEQMGGEIWFDSAVEKGSNFQFFIPFER